MHSEPTGGEHTPDATQLSDDTVFMGGNDTACFNRAPFVSPEVLQGVHLHHAELFSVAGEQILHSIVNAFANGIYDRDYNKLRSTYQPELDEMARELRSLVTRADILLDSITEHIEQKRTSVISTTVTERLYPLLSELESFVDRSFRFEQKRTQEWLARSPEQAESVTLVHFSPDDERLAQERELSSEKTEMTGKKDYRIRLVERHIEIFEKIKTNLKPFRFSAEPTCTSIDANQFLLDLSRRFSSELSFAAKPCSIEMDRSHLEFVCSLALKELFKSGLEIREAAIARGFATHDIFSLSQEEIDSSDTVAQIHEAFFGKIHTDISIPNSDSVALEVSVPPCFATEWRQAVTTLRTSLETANHLLRPYYGEVAIAYIPEDQVVRVSLTVPMRTNNTARTADDCYAEHYSDSESSYTSVPAVMGISFRQPFIDHLGNEASYRVEATGACLLSAEARAQMRIILERTDDYMRSIPMLESVELRATGSAEHIEEAFKKGSYEIVLKGTPARDTRAYQYIHTPLAWESKDTSDSSHEHRFSDYLINQQRISFNARLFFDDDIKRTLTELATVGKLTQIQCEHEQEQRFSATPNRTDEIIRAMIADLGRAIKLIRAQTQPDQVRIQVMEVVAFRIAQVGSFDNIFALNVYNENNQKIANGSFSREKKYWRIIQHDEALIEDTLARVEDAIASIPANKLSFRTLDPELRARHLHIDETLLLNIVKSARGEPLEDTHFSRPSVARIIRSQGDNIAMLFQREGDEIRVIDTHLDAQLEECFGFILDINGENPEEVVNYFVARNLYEKQYPDFQPNEAFLSRYEQEGREPGEAQPI